MTLEDFEKSLNEGRLKSPVESHRNNGHRHSHHHHRRSPQDDEHRHHSGRKRSRHHHDREGSSKRHRSHKHSPRSNSASPVAPGSSEDDWVEKDTNPSVPAEETLDTRQAHAEAPIRRDAWMEAPSALDVDYVQRKAPAVPKPTSSTSINAEMELKRHKNEIGHQLHDLDQDDDVDDHPSKVEEHEVDYTFGDSGSQWRMTKLRAVMRQAEESSQPIEELALERYATLQEFDNAREEQVELERRDTYGKDYVGKVKPSGELFRERQQERSRQDDRGTYQQHNEPPQPPQAHAVNKQPPVRTTVALDQTALNRLKAQMLKAKLRNASNAAALEAEFTSAMAHMANDKEPGVVVLGAMENRMLAGGRRGEAKAVDTKRGRERGLVEENEDMSIEDMVREERRSRGQAGGEGQRFAERIAKDAKFDNDLDYLDENASKLAKRVQKSEINLRNTAIGDFQKMGRILDACPLCHHEDTNTPPVAPIVSLATRVYLTLPTEPEVSEGGACIVPIQHRTNLLHCDDDEWEEIRNFMKSLTRMYHDQGRDVVFYENAAAPQRRRHASMEVVPLPYRLGETAPAFFKEAILTSDEEWSQHKKIIDTLSKARSQGLGKMAFRRTLAKEMPYFHVWFEIDGGLGHIVEDSNRWPTGDLFAREVLGGMLDVEPQIIKKQGRWSKAIDPRTDGFRKRWRKFDWTRVLVDG